MREVLTSFANLPTPYGKFKAAAYRDKDGSEHLVVIKGEVRGKRGVVTRIHSECLTGNVFGSRRCDCDGQLRYAMKRIAKNPCGLILYLRQEGRGHGLTDKLRAYVLQDQGLDTVEADQKLGLPLDTRDYKVAIRIFRQLGVRSVRLLTNNPKKITGLARANLKVERIAVPWMVDIHNRGYLAVKKKKMGHL